MASAALGVDAEAGLLRQLSAKSEKNFINKHKLLLSFFVIIPQNVATDSEKSHCIGERVNVGMLEC
jgi:hypothetical protein